MKKLTKILPAFLFAALLLPACSTALRNASVKRPTGQDILGEDWYGDSATRLFWPDQGWSKDQRSTFYTLSQGSQLIPYPFFIALEQPTSTEPFRSVRNIQKYRYIPQRPGPLNPDGLPVGFVADPGSSLPPQLVGDHRSLGLTCAACHTGQINYHGTAIRIDGGPAMADFDAFLKDLTASLNATASDEAKFSRFTDKILGTNSGDAKRLALRAELRKIAAHRASYDHLNASKVPYGFARLDAFGRIFNNALTIVGDHKGVKANAPVSYPHLWDITREDYVQWTAIAFNFPPGPIFRNVGEAIGVFATVKTDNMPKGIGYANSVNIKNQMKLEDRLAGLKSPKWPEAILGPIDTRLSNRGKVLYSQNCVDCHKLIDKSGPILITTKVPVSEVNTDPLTAENIQNDRGSTGFLKGTLDFVGGKPLPATAPAFGIVGNTVLRTIAGKSSVFTHLSGNNFLVRLADGDFNQVVDAKGMINRPGDGPKMQYKARPLDGIWATAPYLHNGSVSSLYQLLLPPRDRMPTFTVGRREFDPVHVGFRTDPTPGAFLFNTSLEGNHNTGHLYGTTLAESDRLALVEYLKSL